MLKFDQYRWKGKSVSKKIYDLRVKQSKNGKMRKLTNTEGIHQKISVTGRRIVNLEVMAQKLNCHNCQNRLDLKDIKKETRKGMASIFHIQCINCDMLTLVPTDKKHAVGPQTYFDINSKIILGALHAGGGYTSINNLFSTANIPVMSPCTFNTVPTDHDSPVAPSKLFNTVPTDHDSPVAQSLANDTNVQQLAAVNQFVSGDINGEALLRIFGSVDMGYSKGGRTYDSLNGYAAMMSTQTGLILDYTTKNRKCATCDRHGKDYKHNCRLNFYGSAKAMEADATVDLCTNSTILKNANVEVGVLVTDNDSSSICAVRKKSNHEVVNLNDRNHTIKGVANLLFEIMKSKDVVGLNVNDITYLRRCFAYVLTQNEGNVDEMAAGIKNIPRHAYDIHDNCGDFCKYSDDPDNYRHFNIFTKNFHNEQLKKKLFSLFDQLAENVDKYVHLASTQTNESFNNMVCSKAPKSRCYSKSASIDYRVACAVGQKNRRHQYVQDVLINLALSPGHYLSRHIQCTSNSHQDRSVRSKTREFKKRRLFLKNERLQLKFAQESQETNTYKSDITLLSVTAEDDKEKQGHNKPQLSLNITYENSSRAIVFFDLETSGLGANCDILQVAARHDNDSFGQYIEPSNDIPKAASLANHLTNNGRDLFYQGKKVHASTLKEVLTSFLNFLSKIGKKCVLVAHNCAFDGPRISEAMKRTSLENKFTSIVDGFVDTLPLFRNQRKQNKLGTLAEEMFQLDPLKLHDATYDVLVLQNVTYVYFPNENDLLNSYKSVHHTQIYKSLEPLKDCISDAARKRMTLGEISYDKLIDEFLNGEAQILELLDQQIKLPGGREEKIIKVIKEKEEILRHLQLAVQ